MLHHDHAMDSSAAFSFLEGLTDTALHQLSRLVKPTEYECDALLFTEGSERKLLAIVVSGAVAIEKQINGRPIRLVTLGAGEGVRRRIAPRRLAARDDRAGQRHRSVRAGDLSRAGRGDDQ